MRSLTTPVSQENEGSLCTIGPGSAAGSLDTSTMENVSRVGDGWRTTLIGEAAVERWPGDR